MKDTRELHDLVSVGPAMLEDFRKLGIRTVSQLKGKDATALYRKLCRLTGTRQDICVEDSFRAAIEQANDPNLPADRCRWYYWSRIRKGIKK